MQGAPKGIPLWWASQQSSCWPTLQRPLAWSANRFAWWGTGWTLTSSLARMAALAPCWCSQVCYPIYLTSLQAASGYRRSGLLLGIDVSVISPHGADFAFFCAIFFSSFPISHPFCLGAKTIILQTIFQNCIGSPFQLQHLQEHQVYM